MQELLLSLACMQDAAALDHDGLPGGLKGQAGRQRSGHAHARHSKRAREGGSQTLTPAGPQGSGVPLPGLQACRQMRQACLDNRDLAGRGGRHASMTEIGRKWRAVSSSRPRCLNRGWSHTEVAFTIHMLEALCVWCLHGSPNTNFNSLIVQISKVRVTCCHIKTTPLTVFGTMFGPDGHQVRSCARVTSLQQGHCTLNPEPWNEGSGGPYLCPCFPPCPWRPLLPRLSSAW